MSKYATCVTTISVSAVLLAMAVTSAYARHVQIVAIGASVYAGYGVGRDSAFPAILQRDLRRRGYNVTVINSGVSGDTTTDLLARLNSDVPPGTSLVILGSPLINDRRRGISQDTSRANMREMIRRLHARRMKVINGRIGILMRGMPRSDLQPDGIHPTRAGQVYLARRLLPRVMAAIGRR